MSSKIAAASSLQDRLRGHVNTLAGEIGERNVWRPEALYAAARYIEAEFSTAGYEVTSQSYAAEGVSCRNLEVTVPGTSQGIVLAGAHYDTVPGGPGADDNASGVAGVIEIARALRTARPARAVKLVAFVNEEPPFFYFGEMGSKVYAEAARRRGDDIRVMLSLEMLGCYSHARGKRLPGGAPCEPRVRARGFVERPAVVLASRLSRGDGHRHGLLPLSALPPANGYA